MPYGVQAQQFRETMLSYVSRKNGESGVKRYTAGQREADALLLHRLETVPEGVPLVIQDATTGAFTYLPGYDGPLS